MNTTKLFAALDSDLRRKVLTVLVDNPSNVLGVMQKLKNKGLDVKYRETVYRSLETLVDAGLVEKFYDREYGLCYKLLSNRIVVEIKKGLISVS